MTTCPWRACPRPLTPLPPGRLPWLELFNYLRSVLRKPSSEFTSSTTSSSGGWGGGGKTKEIAINNCGWKFLYQQRVIIYCPGFGSFTASMLIVDLSCILIIVIIGVWLQMVNSNISDQDALSTNFETHMEVRGESGSLLKLDRYTPYVNISWYQAYIGGLLRIILI